MPTKFLLVTLVLYIVLGATMWQGCQATKATNRLPVHEYPVSKNQLLSSHINPNAGHALQQIHAMDDVAESYQTITVMTQTKSHPVPEFTRLTIGHRGSASSMKCTAKERHLHQMTGLFRCRLNAALPPKMAQELDNMRHADFQTMQAWIDQQPTTTSWTPTDDDLVLTTVRFEMNKDR